ncbi:O-antigen ligase family protein [Latilactobacillus curvatus]|uniref:O-antigen ligase domain-containing protein n=1 Tax=Latilactobacillus curvatus TaxID=28038 RepID=A0A385ACE4_LATCU|nr:O-antigen ligase family protein [Latilactobacillus curvatus]AXN35283.1 O-antigen ligase domain-containing protein [Latilactobacillus curvatus]MCT3524532.1 O-antigen ligase domain-containing protein [Latilactobacillus curvatus]MCW8780520.1 O-antigen ligase family protein [Latilactobacillus curvatus]UTB70976.1 hypothetical protein A4W71_07800 [Latilactobacillus curvatus]UTB73742.1 hypothetical protein A4W73_02310 [Latilactobacillus curvatus]
MEQLLILISVIQKNILNIPFFSQAAFLGILIILYRRLVDHISLEPLDNLKLRHYAFIGVLALSQLLAFIGLTNEGYGIGSILKKFIIAMITVANFLILYFVMNLLMRNDYQIKKIVTGNFWAFVLLIGICLVQIICVFLGGRLESIVELIGRYLEYHNILNPGSFEKISYTQSTQRVNGLYAESGFLAGVLAIGFAPFIISAMKNKINLFFPNSCYHGWFYYGLFAVLMGVLVLAKTSTGILAVVVMALLLLWAVKGRERLNLIVLYVIAGLLLALIVMRVPALKNMLLSFTVGKTDSDSTTMRLLATQAVFITVLKNPLIGVGFGQTSHFNFINAPSSVKQLAEYQLFLKNKEFPDQSAWGAVLAQFGLIIGIIIVIYIIHLLLDLKKSTKWLQIHQITGYQYDQAIYDSAVYFTIIFLVLGMLSIQWSFDLFILIFFFFVNYRHYLNRKITNNLKDGEVYIYD